MITFYDCATAPSPRRTRILLAEKGVAHETLPIDLRAGEQLGDAFRAINPECTVPALRVEDGKVLTNNAAIAAYLEARFPEPPLLGTSPLEKAEIAGWNWRIEFEGLMAIAEAMRNSAPAMKDRALPGPANYPQIPELAQRGLARLKRFVETLDAAGRFRACRRRPLQPGRHHCRGRRRLRAGREDEARRGACAHRALACGDGGAARDGVVAAIRRAARDYQSRPMCSGR